MGVRLQRNRDTRCRNGGASTHVRSRGNGFLKRVRRNKLVADQIEHLGHDVIGYKGDRLYKQLLILH